MILGNKILIGGGAGTDFTTGLVASWQFENNFLDYTANNHDATATGTVTNNTSGLVGNQADFQGTTDYLTVSDHNDFSFGNGSTDNSFSMALWVKFDTFNASQGVWFINKRGNTTLREYQFLINLNKLIVIQCFDQSTGAFIDARYDMTAEFALNTWFHFVVTYSGGGAETDLKLYLDKVDLSLTHSSSGSYTAMENLSNDVIIGTRAWSKSSGELDGKKEEVKIYKDRVLTSDEITEMYDDELAGISVLP